MSKSAIDKVEDCANALRAFPEGHNLDLRDSVFFDFLYHFGIFLTSGYEKRYSPATAAECLRTLRKYIRLAITRGMVPNIDNIPAVIEKLQTSVWNCEKNSLTKSVKPLKLGIVESVEKLIRSIDTWHTKKIIGARKPADRKERADALMIRCAAMYFFCLMNYGIEIDEALKIKRKPEENGFTIEKFGMELPVSPSAIKLAEIYNDASRPEKYLFSTLENKKYDGDVRKASSLLEDHISQYLTSKGLPLFLQRSVYIDWMNYLIEKGLEADSVERLWQLHRGKISPSDAMSAIARAQNICNGKNRGFAERWYLLNIISPTIKRERFLQLLIASGILGNEKEAAKRIYAPEERIPCKEQGKSSILSRYVFFRSTPAQAQFANVFSPYAYVLKGRERTRFAEIKEREIEDLQIMFRDFPEAVELIDGKKWLETHNAEIVKGCKAVIRSGNLAGKEATVVRIKDRDSESPTFFLEYVEGIIKFQTSLPGLALEIVKD